MICTSPPDRNPCNPDLPGHVEELCTLADSLLARGHAPDRALRAVGYRADLLRRGGADIPEYFDLFAVFRALPEDVAESWHPLSDWAREVANRPDLAEGIEMPDDEAREATRRARELGKWLLLHGHRPLAHRITEQAERLAAEGARKVVS